MTANVDFASEDFFRDPAATVATLRGIGPVVAARFPIVGRAIRLSGAVEDDAHVRAPKLDEHRETLVREFLSKRSQASRGQVHQFADSTDFDPSFVDLALNP